MNVLLALEALFSGEQFTYDLPHTAQIMDNFTYGEFNYLRTNSFYLKKPIGKTLFKKITSSEYNFHRSAWINSVSLSQAKGLLKYTQLSFDI
jgi:hypothetical protein